MERKKSKDMTHRSELNQMRLEDVLCDAVLRVDKVDFKVHKIILSSYSLYFRALFTRLTSLDQTVYIINDVSPDIMDLIITYMYTQDIHITTDGVQALLLAADYLQIKDLVCRCCEFMKENLNVDNCLETWQVTDTLLLCNKLRDHVYTYVLHHFEEVIQSPSSRFLELTAAQLSSILEKDELNIKQEKTAFKAIMKWIEHKPDVRRPHITDLLPKVRLALIDQDYLLQDIKNNPVVSQFLECQPILNQAIKALYHVNMGGPNTRYPDPLACPRLPYSILFTIGGSNERVPKVVIETYNSKRDTWTCGPSADRIRRTKHGTVVLDGFVYVIGGFTGVAYSNTMYKFNPHHKTWAKVSPMHTKRNFLSVAVLDGYIYAIGGCNWRMCFKAVERYDPSTNQWSYVPSMHKPRYKASATTLNGKIYICGGCNSRRTLSKVECFDPCDNRWTQIQMMNTPRKGLGVIALNNRVFAIGGTYEGTYLKSIEVYDPFIDSWSRFSSMIHPRCDFGIAVMDGCLYVVGGRNKEGVISSCERYDGNSDNWFTIQHLNVPREGVTCCVVSGLPNITDYIITSDVSNVRSDDGSGSDLVLAGGVNVTAEGVL